jgi:biotin carboxyl carrier protein
MQAPMPGRVTAIHVKLGQEVQPGDALLSLEAMKMENVLKAEGIGVVSTLHLQEGDVVEKGGLLISFE